MCGPTWRKSGDRSSMGRVEKKDFFLWLKREVLFGLAKQATVRLQLTCLNCFSAQVYFMALPVAQRHELSRAVVTFLVVVASPRLDDQ